MNNNFSALNGHDVIWLVSTNGQDVLEIDNPMYVSDVQVVSINKTEWLTKNAGELKYAERLSPVEAGNLLSYPVVRQAIQDWDADVFKEFQSYLTETATFSTVFNTLSKQIPLVRRELAAYDDQLAPLLKSNPDLWSMLNSQLNLVASAHDQFSELLLYCYSLVQ